MEEIRVDSVIPLLDYLQLLPKYYRDRYLLMLPEDRARMSGRIFQSMEALYKELFILLKETSSLPECINMLSVHVSEILQKEYLWGDGSGAIQICTRKRREAIQHLIQLIENGAFNTPPSTRRKLI